MTLSEPEQRLFAKYWGVKDLIDNDQFWQDAFDWLPERNIPLPIEHSPLSVRLAQDMLDCKQCGDCCRYAKIRVGEIDTWRMIHYGGYSTKELEKLIHKEEGGNYLHGQPDGCPFLKDNKCTIYKYRPDTCYMFPIQSPIKATAEGEEREQMRIRIKCSQSLAVIRNLIRIALGAGGKILLPNLAVISNDTGE